MRRAEASDYDVACPKCHAKAGSSCRWRGDVYPGLVHRERRRLAEEAPQ